MKYLDFPDKVKTLVAFIWLFTLFTNYMIEPKSMSKFTMYLRYGALALIQFIFTYAVAYPLTPLVVLFASKDGWLPGWLRWFQTFDATIDSAWQDSYQFCIDATPSNWFQYVWTYRGAPDTPTGLNLFMLRCRWLWRNAAYGFDYWPCGLVYDPSQWIVDVCDVTNGILTKFSARTVDGLHFCYTDSKGTKLGWKLWWALDSNFKLLPADQFEHVANARYGDTTKRLMLVCTP